MDITSSRHRLSRYAVVQQADQTDPNLQMLRLSA
jgi:hypothetical protein